ncbi:organomercurial lyase [Nocardia sp. NPDC058518]|uniref:alkylmercury lyase family protein n=1 Tax=Nocardia sp. NPDC058518 TaxID=3346534 RepID=UPI00366A3473
MSTPQRRIRDLVYDIFATQGRAPSIAELARLTQSTSEAVQRLLHELADAHALVLAPDGDAVRMAHPFTAAPMAFVVTPAEGYDDRRWWGGCAWDSFGISAALHLDVRIDTACPHCGTGISFRSGPDTEPPAELVVRFPRPAAQWWDDVVATCTMIRMFCDREHAEQWTADHAPGSGYIADGRAVWRLAGPWYGDRLHPDFEPHTREHNQQLLDACGLTGSFWQLP